MEENKKPNSKKLWIWIIAGILLISGIGLITYLFWPKKPSETKQTTKRNYSSTQQFQNQINQIKQKLNDLENKNQQKSLETRLTSLENKLNNLTQQINSEQVKISGEIQQEIKEISEELGLNNQEAPVSGQSLDTHTHTHTHTQKQEKLADLEQNLQTLIQQTKEVIKPLEKLIKELEEEKFAQEKYLSLLQEEAKKEKDRNFDHSWRMEILKTTSKITRLDSKITFEEGAKLKMLKTFLTNAEQTFSITNEQVKIINQERFIRILQEEKAEVPQWIVKTEEFYKEITKKERGKE